MKIAINGCYGGFGLSKKAYEFLGIPWDGYGYKYCSENERTDPKLIECIETLGKEASGELANIHVVDVPDDVDWCISEYDGIETVEEVHRSWS